MEIIITMPSLERIEALGLGTIRFDDFSGEDLEKLSRHLGAGIVRIATHEDARRDRRRRGCRRSGARSVRQLVSRMRVCGSCACPSCECRTDAPV